MTIPPVIRRQRLWLATALLALLLAQVAVLAHDATAPDHDDPLCQLCLAGNSVGAPLAAALPLPAPVPVAPAPARVPRACPVRLVAVPWQARAPPALPA